eukprot:gene4902-9776_t
MSESCIKSKGKLWNFPNISSDDWILVRHIPAGNYWHPSRDYLRGSDEYGLDNCDISSLTGSTAFSFKFDSILFDKFLFATGDMQKWLIATKEAVSADGVPYSNEPRDIISSSYNSSPYRAKWYNRQRTFSCDPQITLYNHHENDKVGGEEGTDSGGGGNVLIKNNGANVFIHSIETPLNKAIRNGDINTVTHILGDKDNRIVPWLLHLAIKMSNNIEIILLLLRNGYNITGKDEKGRQPLDYLNDSATSLNKEHFFIGYDIPIDILSANTHALWFYLIQITDVVGIEGRIKQYVKDYPNLVEVRDIDDRRANDHMMKNVDSEGHPRKVALKLMRIKGQFQREVNSRAADYDPRYVVKILTTYPAMSSISEWPDEVSLATDSVKNINISCLKKDIAERLYTLVMPLAD